MPSWSRWIRPVAAPIIVCLACASRFGARLRRPGREYQDKCWDGHEVGSAYSVETGTYFFGNWEYCGCWRGGHDA